MIFRRERDDVGADNCADAGERPLDGALADANDCFGEELVKVVSVMSGPSGSSVILPVGDFAKHRGVSLSEWRNPGPMCETSV